MDTNQDISAYTFHLNRLVSQLNVLMDDLACTYFFERLYPPCNSRFPVSSRARDAPAKSTQWDEDHSKHTGSVIRHIGRYTMWAYLCKRNHLDEDAFNLVDWPVEVNTSKEFPDLFAL